jgi:hypothetical protein
MDPDSSGGWRFAQCFGDKGEVEDITEGSFLIRYHSHVNGLSLSFRSSLFQPMLYLQ